MSVEHESIATPAKMQPYKIEEAYLDCLLDGDNDDDAVNDLTTNELVTDHDVVAKSEMDSDLSSEKNQELDLSDSEKVEECDSEEVSTEHDDNDLNGLSNSDELIRLDSLDLMKSQEAPFVCQLIKVSGLILALPIACFDRIVDIPETATINPNKKSLCFAKFNREDESIYVIALPRLLVPEASVDASRKVILLGNKGFSLLCDEVLSTVSIDACNVKWRSDNSKRKWLAGTVSKQGCSILDVTGILQSATQH